MMKSINSKEKVIQKLIENDLFEEVLTIDEWFMQIEDYTKVEILNFIGVSPIKLTISDMLKLNDAKATGKVIILNDCYLVKSFSYVGEYDLENRHLCELEFEELI